MTVYQELQLSCAGSKNLIRRTENKEEKKRHILIYNVKVYLVVAFCFAVVTAFSVRFGSANSIGGGNNFRALCCWHFWCFVRQISESVHRMVSSALG